MADYEEGELADSEEELKNAATFKNNLLYRSNISVFSSSESETESSDSESNFKRKKISHQKKPTPPPPSIISPEFTKAAEAFQNFHSKKVNNIWSSVLEEQSLTQDLSRFDVQAESLPTDERGIESYHYRFKNNNGNYYNNSSQLFNSRRRGIKRSIKDRIGKRTYNRNKIRDINVIESDPLEKVITEITTKLQEPKQELIERVVKILGTKKALELYYMTEDVEDAGGMMTFDGSRRRTPGGVFFQILKSDKYISEKKMNFIFSDEEIVNTKKYVERQKHKKGKQSKNKSKDKRNKKNKNKMVIDENENKEAKTEVENVEVNEDVKMCE